MSNVKQEEAVDKAKTRTVSLKNSSWIFIDSFCETNYMKASNFIQRAVDELTEKLKKEGQSTQVISK